MGGATLRLKALVESKEIKALLEETGTPSKAKPAPSKGITPIVTTAATSRNTQSPPRKVSKRDDSTEVKHHERSHAQTTQRKLSATKAAVYQSPNVPKGLKSAYKSKKM